MRVAVCSVLFTGASPQDPTIQSHIAYCNRHKYDYVCPSSLEQVSPRALQEPARFQTFLLQRLTDSYDLVLWLDPDLPVQNMELPVELIAQEFMAWQHIALCQPAHATRALLVRKSADTARWLEVFHHPDTLKNKEFAARLAVIPGAWPILFNESPYALTSPLPIHHLEVGAPVE